MPELQNESTNNTFGVQPRWLVFCRRWIVELTPFKKFCRWCATKNSTLLLTRFYSRCCHNLEFFKHWMSSRHPDLALPYLYQFLQNAKQKHRDSEGHHRVFNFNPPESRFSLLTKTCKSCNNATLYWHPEVWGHKTWSLRCLWTCETKRDDFVSPPSHVFRINSSEFAAIWQQDTRSSLHIFCCLAVV